MADEMGMGTWGEFVVEWKWGHGGNFVVEWEWGHGGNLSPADGRAIKMAPRCG